MASQDRFGFEWSKYSKIDPNHEIQLKSWVRPLTPNDFKNKKILDAGCGMGRNSFWCLNWGAKEIVAFDFDERSVAVAKKNLSAFNNASILYKSIYDINWGEEFDLAFSIGVIHHLENPELAIKNLYRALKRGGTLIIWVYSYEGNEWLVRYINPIRKCITSKLPVSIVHSLTYFLSIPLWIFVKIFKGPGSYLKQLADFSFWHIHSIVFDQFIPKVANYWKKDEILSVFKNIRINNFNIHRPHNNCGWTVMVKK